MPFPKNMRQSRLKPIDAATEKPLQTAQMPKSEWRAVYCSIEAGVSADMSSMTTSA